MKIPCLLLSCFVLCIPQCIVSQNIASIGLGNRPDNNSNLNSNPVQSLNLANSNRDNNFNQAILSNIAIHAPVPQMFNDNNNNSLGKVLENNNNSSASSGSGSFSMPKMNFNLKMATLGSSASSARTSKSHTKQATQSYSHRFHHLLLKEEYLLKKKKARCKKGHVDLTACWKP
jgi:hypothetical protein